MYRTNILLRYQQKMRKKQRTNKQGHITSIALKLDIDISVHFVLYTSYRKQ